MTTSADRDRREFIKDSPHLTQLSKEHSESFRRRAATGGSRCDCDHENEGEEYNTNNKDYEDKDNKHARDTASIVFMDGSNVSVSQDMTVNEARKVLTPPRKMYTNLDLSFQGDILKADDKIGCRVLHGVWRKVKRLP